MTHILTIILFREKKDEIERYKRNKKRLSSLKNILNGTHYIVTIASTGNNVSISVTGYSLKIEPVAAGYVCDFPNGVNLLMNKFKDNSLIRKKPTLANETP